MSVERLDHEAVSARLGRFEFGAFDDAERCAIEAHVLECDACFAELERGAVVAGTMRDTRTRFAALLAGARDATARPDAMPGERDRGLLARLRGLLGPPLAPRVVAPAFAILLALAIVAVRHFARAPDTAHFATFPRDDLATTIVRGPNVGDAVRELMEAGAGYFDTGRYDEAARRFRAALDRDPTLAEAAYLVGLSTALAGDAEAAVPELDRAARLAGPELRPKATWVLANAELKAGRVEQAKTILVALSAGESEYARLARALLMKLPR